MNKVIYIAGLGHSGSTILDMSLGAHSCVLGLGELANLLIASSEDFQNKQFNEILCSCGGDLNTCVFWKKAKHILINSHSDSLANKYEKIIDFCTKEYGQSIIIVDSSKNIYEHLRYLDAKYDLRVIFLIRDCRSWSYSRHSRHGTNMTKLAYTWLIGNLRIKRFLVNHNITFKQFGYEEIALFPKIMLNKICNFIGIQFEENVLDQTQTKSHIIRGNIARCDSKKKEGFIYDCRWLTSIKLSIISTFILPALLWNNKNVYTNFITGNTYSFGRKQRDFILFGDSNKEVIAKKSGDIHA